MNKNIRILYSGKMESDEESDEEEATEVIPSKLILLNRSLKHLHRKWKV